MTLTKEQRERFTNVLNELAEYCFNASKDAGWYSDLETGESTVKTRNDGEQFMLMVSELAEAFEGLRKNRMDDHIPYRKNVEVEIGDALIRQFDYCGRYALDIGGAVCDKIEYNSVRPDHKIENRKKKHGKKF